MSLVGLDGEQVCPLPQTGTGQAREPSQFADCGIFPASRTVYNSDTTAVAVMCNSMTLSLFSFCRPRKSSPGTARTKRR